MRCGALCLRRSICVLTGGLATHITSACGLHVPLHFPDHGPSVGARFPARGAAHCACIGSISAMTGGPGWLRISRLILFCMSCFTSCAHDPIRERRFFCPGPPRNAIPRMAYAHPRMPRNASPPTAPQARDFRNAAASRSVGCLGLLPRPHHPPPLIPLRCLRPACVV